MRGVTKPVYCAWCHVSTNCRMVCRRWQVLHLSQAGHICYALAGLHFCAWCNMSMNVRLVCRQWQATYAMHWQACMFSRMALPLRCAWWGRIIAPAPAALLPSLPCNALKCLSGHAHKVGTRQSLCKLVSEDAEASASSTERKREYSATLHHEASLHHQLNSAAQDVHHELAPPVKSAAQQWGSTTSAQCKNPSALSSGIFESTFPV